MDAALPAPSHRTPLVLRTLLTRPALVATLAVALLTTVLFLVVPRPLSPDVAGQLWIAERLRHGARLYLDIAEINPPLWFWLAVPVDALAEAIGARAADVLIPLLGAVALAGLLATDRLLPRLAPGAKTALLVYGAAVLLVMPLRDLGQREQLTLIGAIPYAALITARREGRPVAGWLAVAVGAGAVVGFAFKHYFIAAPLLLEAWLIVGRGRAWRPWRPEALVLAGAALLYVAAIVLVTPAFFTVSLPELTLAYGGGPPDPAWWLRPAQPVWLLIGAALVIERRALPPVATALLIAALGFALAWAIQHKGWPYQSIPATGLLAIALATTLACGRWRRPRPVTLAALAAPLLLAAIPTQWAPTAATDIAPALADLRPGDTVALIARESRTAWPATLDRGLRFVGRRGSFWMLGAIDAHPGDARLQAFGRRVARQTAVDLGCLPPRRIVFAPGRAAGGTTASDDPLEWFARDPAFAALLRHYRRLDRRGNVDAFELARPFPPSPRAGCLRF